MSELINNESLVYDAKDIQKFLGLGRSKTYKFLELVYINKQPFKVMKIDRLLNDYLVYWFERVYSPRVETSTRMVGAYTLYNLIMPNIEKQIKLKLVTTEYLDSLLANIAPICPSAGNKSRELLHQAFQEAVEEDILDENQVKNCKKYLRKKTKINIYTEKELKKFLKIVSNDNWYLEILLAVFCGLRKGEILALKFEDFDIENKTVKIYKQLVPNLTLNKNMKDKGFKIIEYNILEKDPKTFNSTRTLRVPQIIINELKNRAEIIETKKNSNANFIDEGYISVQDSGVPHAFTSLNGYLDTICKRNGLRKITVHGLRHMFATILLELNVPITKISALLGHKSIHTTYEIYCDVMDDTERINAFINNNFVPGENY